MHHEIKALVSFKGKSFFDTARSESADLAAIATWVAAAPTPLEPDYWIVISRRSSDNPRIDVLVRHASERFEKAMPRRLDKLQSLSIRLEPLSDRALSGRLDPRSGFHLFEDTPDDAKMTTSCGET